MNEAQAILLVAAKADEKIAQLRRAVWLLVLLHVVQFILIAWLVL